MLQGKAKGNSMITNIRNIEDYKHYVEEKNSTRNH